MKKRNPTYKKASQESNKIMESPTNNMLVRQMTDREAFLSPVRDSLQTLGQLEL